MYSADSFADLPLKRKGCVARTIVKVAPVLTMRPDHDSGAIEEVKSTGATVRGVSPREADRRGTNALWA